MLRPRIANRKKQSMVRKSPGGSSQKPLPAADSLLALMSNKRDRSAIRQMMQGRAVADSARAQRIALKVSELAGAALVDPLDMSLQQDLISHALMFAGINADGYSYVPDDKVQDVLDKVLPIAFGEGRDAVFFNDSIVALLAEYAASPDPLSHFSEATRVALNTFLTQERREALAAMLDDGRVSMQLSPEQMARIRGVQPVAVSVPNDIVEINPSGDEAPRASAAPIAEEAPPELSSEPNPDRAQLGYDSVRPDSAELSARARLDAERYQLDVDMQTDALLQLNDLMRRNPTWVNRSVREKLKDYLRDKVDGAIGASPFNHPAESLFSETLADVDETGRAKNEMVKFSRGPLNGFKATFKTPSAPKDAYLAACYRLRAEGVRHPYIKTTFRDPDAARMFLEQMVSALEESGYHLDDIRVSPNLEEMFRYLKETKYPAFTLEEAPQSVVDTPDDPTVIQEQSPPELALERARRLSEDMLRQQYPGLSEAEALHNALREVNQVALQVADSRNDPERPLNFRDIDPNLMVAVLSRRPLLALSGETWNSAMSAGGLLPTAQKVVQDVVSEFERLIDLADPAIDSGRAELGVHQRNLLLKAKDTLLHVMPERSEQLASVFAFIEGQSRGVSRDEPPSPLPAESLHPDATSVPQDDFTPSMEEQSGMRPQDVFGDSSEYGHIPPAPPFDGSMDYDGGFMPPSPPLESYDDSMAPPPQETEDESWVPATQREWEQGLYTQGADDAAALDEFNQSILMQNNDSLNLQNGTAAPHMNAAHSGLQNTDSREQESEMNPTETGVSASDLSSIEREIDPLNPPPPDDVQLPPIDLSFDAWSHVLNKEWHELPQEVLVEMAQFSPVNCLMVSLLAPDEQGWSVEALLEFKNTFDTVRSLTDARATPESLLSAGEREMKLLAHLPDEVVPEALRSMREDYIAKRNDEVVIGQPTSIPPALDALKAVVGCELHEIPADIMRTMCTMGIDDVQAIRGLKVAEGWDPLQLDEVRNALETVRLLHEIESICLDDLSAREQRLVMAMPEDVRPTVVSHERFEPAPDVQQHDDAISRMSSGPRP